MLIYRRALSYFLPDWRRVIGLVFLIIGIVAFSTALAWPMPLLIDVVLSSTPKTGFVYDLFRSAVPQSPLLQIAALAAIFLFIKFALDLLSCLRSMLNNSIKYRGTVRVRRNLYRHMQALGPAYHNSQPQGDAIFRLSNDTFGPFGIFDTIFSTAEHAATLIVVTTVMFSRCPSLTLFAWSLAPLMLISTRYFGRHIKRRADESRHIDATLMTFVQRTISRIHLIQAYNRQPHEEQRYDAALTKSVDAAMRLNWRENLFPFTIQCIYGLGQAALLGYGGYMVYRDQNVLHLAKGMTVGDLTLFMAYFSQMLNPLADVAGFMAQVKTSVAASERVFSVLAQDPDIADVADAVELPVKPRALRINNLSFGYDGQKLAVRELCADIAPGEMVAFIGASGAGKSTLVNLLPRFYDPTAGQVCLDGIDLRRLKLSSLREHVIIVSQENGLLAGTVAENIRYGNLAAGDDEVEYAAALAGAAEFIEALPDKYQTQIAEGGKNLSGGQRQRLAIARALLTAAPILIFDEPTSALDIHTEQTIINTLTNLKRTRTIILVTHRLTSVRHCDRIYVMDSGRIVEQGTYAQLTASQGFALLREVSKQYSVA